MTLPQSDNERAAESGGVPATPEPWEGTVHVEATIAATIKTWKHNGFQDAADAKAYAEEAIRKDLVKLGYEILDIKSTLGDTP